MFVVWWRSPAQGMPRKDECRIYAEFLQLPTSRRRETSSKLISRMRKREKRTAKEKSTTTSEGILREELHCVKTSTPATTGTADTWDKRSAPREAVSPPKKFQKTGSVQAPSWLNNDTVATVVQHVMTELSELLRRQ
jgi:hypothetical protein